MGKMKGDIYKYYMVKYDATDPANSTPKLPKWECRFCSKQYVQNATKMRHHVLNMCEEIPAPLKLALLDIPNVSFNEDSVDEAHSFLDSLGVGSTAGDLAPPKLTKKPFLKPPLKKRKTLTIPPSHSSQPRLAHGQNLNSSSSANNATSSEGESLWVLLARAVYASGAPLDMFENPYWIDLFQRVSPGTSLPTAQLLCKDLLENEVNKIDAVVKKHVEDATYVGVQCKTWFTKRGDSMTTFVVTTPSPFSYKTYPSGLKGHDERLVADSALDCIRQIESSGSKVLSFVSSAERQVHSCWTKIQQVNPLVLTFACVVESLEFFMNAILMQEDIAELLEVVSVVISKLRRSSTARSKFDQIQLQINEKIRRLHMFKTSRSLSYLVCLQSILYVQNALKWLAMDDESVQLVGQELSFFVSEEFWTKVDLTLKVLFPVIKWLNIMKENKAEISLVPKAFIEIQTALDQLQLSMLQNVYPVLAKVLNEQKELCMKSVHLAANLLDPREQGSCLDQDQILQATEFIDTFADAHGFDSSAVIAELSQFRMKSDFYSKPFLWKVTEKIQGSVWWSTMATKGHLAKLAAAILNIHPVTFKMDKTFTDAAFQCSSSSDSRNYKLIYVAHNLRISPSLCMEVGESNGLQRTESTEGKLLKSSSNGIILLDRESLENLCNRSDYADSESEEEEQEDGEGEDEQVRGSKVLKKRTEGLLQDSNVDIKLTPMQQHLFPQ